MAKPSIDPQRWRPPVADPSEPSAAHLAHVHPVSGKGPEDVLVLADGSVLTGLEDGRIVRVDPESGREHPVVDTGGRPFGLEMHPDGGVVVCDGFRGPLHLSDDGTLTTLLDRVEGVALKFCNNAAVAADGTIFFSDSTRKFGPFDWRADLLEHRPTGRLLRRDPDGRVDVLLDGLAFANGVALTPTEDAVIVAETAGYVLRRVDLASGAVTQFGPVLTGFPDNIALGDDGLIWVTIASPRDPALDTLLPRAPWMRSVVWSLPDRFQPQPKSTIHVQAYEPTTGRRVHDVETSHPDFGMVTGVRKAGNRVWLGSLESRAIAALSW
ncbi:SMP-30/gluconolactonase/LRE family protein [Aeromicrobium camelliae]|uniref:SMP-30/gluconolactonase/LRE family protein n=1 Tax=Aeromicrobium camelliae TaxID=1538144 RepID=A0A3N6X2Y6_9ACTN|nr:SMP-30/gluconolactonase/LRE family protein [Aeromicrobium camelliae]RQN08485.1 SMP-30/gluconolactonase/LRE family protein [Aeromicrobium camelliae]